MLHPIIESLFFLKLTRDNICESIKNSSVSNKNSLINYIRNEASDFEVMHLSILGEMPENKFDAVTEAALWNLFKEEVVLNASSLSKNMLKEDILNIVYEMGPVSDLGYSSAAPILEFDRANGRLDIGYLSEATAAETRSKNKAAVDASALHTKAMKNTINQANVAKDQSMMKQHPKSSEADTLATKSGVPYNPQGTQPVNTTPTWQANVKQKGLELANQYGKQAAAGAVGAAGLYGLYKLYKAYKAKKAAAKTPEQKAAADKGIAKVQAKIKAKKGKK